MVGSSNSGAGLEGLSKSGVGIIGQSDTGDAAQFTVGPGARASAVYAKNLSTNGAAYAVLAVSSGGDAVHAEANGGASAIYGKQNSATGYAGYFDGKVHVTGMLEKAGGGFKIDHPLDPSHKYLSHSFVESPDMLNIYNGNTALNEQGESWVQLPPWFETLNGEFRYQLTPVGAAAPNLHVAQEIQSGRFKIAGGPPKGKVSWQVTGVRNDAYAQAHRIQVEENKRPEEQGLYLHPEAFGQSPSKRLSSFTDSTRGQVFRPEGS